MTVSIRDVIQIGGYPVIGLLGILGTQLNSLRQRPIDKKKTSLDEERVKLEQQQQDLAQSQAELERTKTLITVWMAQVQPLSEQLSRTNQSLIDLQNQFQAAQTKAANDLTALRQEYDAKLLAQKGEYEAAIERLKADHDAQLKQKDEQIAELTTEVRSLQQQLGAPASAQAAPAPAPAAPPTSITILSDGPVTVKSSSTT